MGYILNQISWTWIILGPSLHFQASGKQSVSLPDIMDRKFIDDCVQMHNKARSAVSPPASDMQYMTWDAGLAVTARAWSRNCDFSHNIHLGDARRMHPVFRSVGENIWTGYPPNNFNVKRAIDSWVAENVNYTYSNNKCRYVCGHYTQVVWATSYKVGCAVQICANGVKHFSRKEGAIFVCNYATGGNEYGKQPYSNVGSACSKCKDTCQGKLCRSQARDPEQSYNWTPDWDPALSSCGPSCLAVLAIRPLAILFTFITAYGVHRLYPNVFCYE